MSAKPKTPPVKKLPVRVTISKETTYITEPLRPDGYPDYVAELNRRFSDGVTPENNAVVLFWKALGPRLISEKYRNRHFQMLGIPPLPEKGNYFVSLDDYAKLHKDAKRFKAAESIMRTDVHDPLRTDLEAALKRPWSKEEFPLLADWLATNEAPMSLLVDASKRSRCYDAMISENYSLVDGSIVGDNSVLNIILALLDCHENVFMPLTARAMQRIREGKLDAAWEDLLACHRLARLMGQEACPVYVHVAFRMDRIADMGDIALVQSSELTRTQIERMRHDRVRLPPMPKLADKINLCERFTFLDSMMLVAKKGLNELFRVGLLVRKLDDSDRGMPSPCEGWHKWVCDALGRLLIDWDSVLRIGNFWYDKEVAACRRPTQRERRASLVAIDNEIGRLFCSVKHPFSSAVSTLLDPFRSMSRWTGYASVGMFLPAFRTGQLTKEEDTWMMQSELTNAAIALAAYRADHGTYPATLAGLVPKYVAEMPKDIFNDADLHYRQEGGGYLLYGVGWNGEDNGGNTPYYPGDHPDWDDLAIRMPATKK